VGAVGEPTGNAGFYVNGHLRRLAAQILLLLDILTIVLFDAPSLTISVSVADFVEINSDVQEACLLRTLEILMFKYPFIC
jgi:hypothetical protein